MFDHFCSETGNNCNVVNITINQSPKVCLSGDFITSGQASEWFYPLYQNPIGYLASGTIIDLGKI